MKQDGHFQHWGRQNSLRFFVCIILNIWYRQWNFIRAPPVWFRQEFYCRLTTMCLTMWPRTWRWSHPRLKFVFSQHPDPERFRTSGPPAALGSPKTKLASFTFEGSSVRLVAGGGVSAFSSRRTCAVEVVLRVTCIAMEHWMCACSSILCTANRPTDKQTRKTTKQQNAECQSWDLLHSHYTLKKGFFFLYIGSTCWFFLYCYTFVKFAENEFLLHFVKWEQLVPRNPLFFF